MRFRRFNFDLEFGGFDGLVTDLYRSREIPLASSLLEVSVRYILRTDD
jgi:hypothetical protein